jgi:hypothetical protein
MRALLERALAAELRGALPPRLTSAREDGFRDYFTNAQHGARIAAARRRHRAEELRHRPTLF